MLCPPCFVAILTIPLCFFICLTPHPLLLYLSREQNFFSSPPTKSYAVLGVYTMTSEVRALEDLGNNRTVNKMGGGGFFHIQLMVPCES